MSDRWDDDARLVARIARGDVAPPDQTDNGGGFPGGDGSILVGRASFTIR